MKRVGIITIQSYTPNFGNRLQNYAVQEVYRKLGCMPITLMYCKNRLNKRELIRYLLFKITPKKVKDSRLEFIIKKHIFCKFNKKYLKYKYVKNFDDNLSVDLLSVGSDQVWNTNWMTDELKRIFFLLFTDKITKIAFAASIGVEAIPDDEEISRALNSFRKISVREEAGASSVQKITNNDVTVIVDPTLLLTRGDWQALEKRPKNIKKGYVLTYFLDGKSESANNYLLSHLSNRRVYNLTNVSFSENSDIGPCEFLWLIGHADIVLTDSFHACVFSIIYNKPFLVFDRKIEGASMNSRLDTLLKTFKLERKYVNSAIENDIFEHNYDEAYVILEEERRKARSFLMNALGD